MATRPARAGDSIEDYCRACRTDRMHTVIVVDGSGGPLRVSCGFCRSEHNYRGGPRIATGPPGPRDTGYRPPGPRRSAHAAPPGPQGHAYTLPADLQDPEHSASDDGVSDMAIDHDATSLEALLRRVIREETGLTPVAPAPRWRGGTMVLRPGTPGLQEKTWPVDAFFHKIVMLRNRLRTLEQQLNASDLPDDAKLKMQSYITGCYGTLTSFNLLFADEDDQFKGAGGE